MTSQILEVRHILKHPTIERPWGRRKPCISIISWSWLRGESILLYSPWFPRGYGAVKAEVCVARINNETPTLITITLWGTNDFITDGRCVKVLQPLLETCFACFKWQAACQETWGTDSAASTSKCQWILSNAFGVDDEEGESCKFPNMHACVLLGVSRKSLAMMMSLIKPSGRQSEFRSYIGWNGSLYKASWRNDIAVASMSTSKPMLG